MTGDRKRRGAGVQDKGVQDAGVSAPWGVSRLVVTGMAEDKKFPPPTPRSVSSSQSPIIIDSGVDLQLGCVLIQFV